MEHSPLQDLNLQTPSNEKDPTIISEIIDPSLENEIKPRRRRARKKRKKRKHGKKNAAIVATGNVESGQVQVGLDEEDNSGEEDDDEEDDEDELLPNNEATVTKGEKKESSSSASNKSKPVETHVALAGFLLSRPSSDQLKSKNIYIDPLELEAKRSATLTGLDKHLQHRPPPSELFEKNVLVQAGGGGDRRGGSSASAAILGILKRPQHSSASSASIGFRHGGISSSDHAIVPPPIVDPGILVRQHSIVRSQDRDRLSRSLRNRMSLGDLVKRNILLLERSGSGWAEEDAVVGYGGAIFGSGNQKHSNKFGLSSSFIMSNDGQKVSETSENEDRDSSDVAAALVAAAETAAGSGTDGGYDSTTATGPINVHISRRKQKRVEMVLAALLERRPSVQAMVRAARIKKVMMWTLLDVTGYGGLGDQQQSRNCASLSLVGRKLYLLGGHENSPRLGESSGVGIGTGGLSTNSGIHNAHTGGQTPFGSNLHSSSNIATEMSNTSTSLFTTQVLDIDRSCWERVPTRSAAGFSPVARYAHATVVIRHFLVIFGGYGGGIWRNDVWILDTMGGKNNSGGGGSGISTRASGNSWTASSTFSHVPVAPVPSLPPGLIPTNASDRSATLLSKNSFGVTAGADEPEPLTWYLPPILSSEAPLPRAAHSCVVMSNVMYLFGGNNGSSLFNDTWTLDFNCLPLRWSQIFPIGTPPSPRSGHSAVQDGHGRMYVFGGGEGWGAESSFNDLFLLDTRSADTGLEKSTNTTVHVDTSLVVATGPVWIRPSFAGAPPSPRTGHSAVILGGSSMFVFGGGDATRTLNDLHVLDLTTLCWSRPADTGALPLARAGHATCAVGDYLLVMFGGAAPDGSYMNDLHMLDVDFSYYSTAAAAAAETEVQETIKDKALIKHQQEDNETNSLETNTIVNEASLDNPLKDQEGILNQHVHVDEVPISYSSNDIKATIGGFNTSTVSVVSSSSSTVRRLSSHLRRPSTLPAASPPPVAALRRRYSWSARVSTTEMLAAALDVNRSHKNKQSSTHLKQLGEDLGEDEDDEEEDKQEERGRKRDITVESSESRGMTVQATVNTVLESIKTELKVKVPDTEQEAIVAAEVLLKELERYTAMLTESLMVKVSN